MKKAVLIFLYVITCFFSTPVIAGSSHFYFNGRVRAVSDTAIQVESRTFNIAPGCKVLLQQRRNGAFFQEPGRFHDIYAGESVTVKVEGSRVYEILIERWKR